MKKKFLAIALAICAAVCAATLCGCVNINTDDGDGEKTEIANGHVLAYAFTAQEGETGTMLDAMNKLKANGDLLFEGTNGSYGFFVSSVFGVGSKTVSSTEHSYAGWDWAVYTTVTTIDGVIYAGEQSTTVGGVKLFKSSYGVSGLPLVAGESYALVYEYSYMTF